MRCGCPLCGALTVQQQHGMSSQCICPECGWICRDCMGDGQGKFTPLSKEEVELMKKMKTNP